MSDGWDALLAIALPLGEVIERRSRFADKPALCVGSREVAHAEAPDVIDLRITKRSWDQVSADYAGDAAVVRVPGRRDWIELRVSDAADVERLRPLIEAAIAANSS